MLAGPLPVLRFGHLETVFGFLAGIKPAKQRLRGRDLRNAYLSGDK
jgi:hypothetical protein